MKLEEFEIAYSGLSGVSAVAAELGKKVGTHVLARGLCGSSRALLLASVFARTGKHLLVVVEDAEEAGYLKSDIEKLVNGAEETNGANGKKVFLFPATHRIRQKGQDESYTIQRTEVLTRLEGKEPCVVVTFPDALNEEVVTQEMFRTRSIEVQVGQEISEQQLAE